VTFPVRVHSILVQLIDVVGLAGINTTLLEGQRDGPLFPVDFDWDGLRSAVDFV
jgi:hypothetical protein